MFSLTLTRAESVRFYGSDYFCISEKHKVLIAGILRMFTALQWAHPFSAKQAICGIALHAFSGNTSFYLCSLHINQKA